MNYRLFVYIFCVLLSVFVVSGMNLNPMFKKGHIWEERIFVILLSVIIGYLTASFIFAFFDVSRII